jgi:hypothetical protein
MFAFLMCLLVQASFGQRISRSYNNRSMSEVLKDLDKATRRYKISFIYNELGCRQGMAIVCRTASGSEVQF